MPYIKTIYVDKETPLNAENFNKSETALEQGSKDIEILSNAAIELSNKIEKKANISHDHDGAYADKLSEHTHSNKITLDKITDAKLDEWNNKSSFSGDYGDLINIPPNSYPFEITAEQWRLVDSLYEYVVAHNLNNLNIDCDLYVNNKKILADIEPLNKNELKVTTTENYNAKVVIKIN